MGCRWRMAPCNRLRRSRSLERRGEMTTGREVAEVNVSEVRTFRFCPAAKLRERGQLHVGRATRETQRPTVTIAGSTSHIPMHDRAFGDPPWLWERESYLPSRIRHNGTRYKRKTQDSLSQVMVRLSRPLLWLLCFWISADTSSRRPELRVLSLLSLDLWSLSCRSISLCRHGYRRSSAAEGRRAGSGC